jgi:Ca2+/Na+ antiporter
MTEVQNSLPHIHNDVATERGAHRRKHHIRAAFRCGTFVLLVAGFYAHNHWHGRFRANDSSCLDHDDNQSTLGESQVTASLRPMNSLFDSHKKIEPPYSPALSSSNDFDGAVLDPVLKHYQLQDGVDATTSSDDESTTTATGRRMLQEAEPELQAESASTQKKCSDIKVASPTWMLTFYIIGVLYMFLGLAIVCDEFFVPALEEMADEDHLNMSMDVAGATLMAAGGSAPELFTSFFGTFQESEVGIGTIVGSAVFNVLFVIACCAMAIPEPLELTWWPLFRDCSYYVVGLILLAVFVGVVSPGKIVFWEALVLFLGYLGYVIMMKYNEALYKLLTKKNLNSEEGTEDFVADEVAGEQLSGNDSPSNSSVNEDKEEIEIAAESCQMGGAAAGGEAAAAVTPRGSGSSNNLVRRHTDMPRSTPADGALKSTSSNGVSTVQSDTELAKHSEAITLSIRNGAHKEPSCGKRRWDKLTFRAGILKLLRDPDSWATTAGIGVVSQIEGSAETVFAKVDTNNDGSIDFEELKVLLNELELNLNENQARAVMDEIDSNKDNMVRSRIALRLFFLVFFLVSFVIFLL